MEQETHFIIDKQKAIQLTYLLAKIHIAIGTDPRYTIANPTIIHIHNSTPLAVSKKISNFRFLRVGNHLKAS